MNQYRLEALLLLRRNAMDEAVRELGVLAAAAREAAREHQRLISDVESRRNRASDPYPDGWCDTVRCSARAREGWRRTVQVVRQRLDLQQERLQRAVAAERDAARVLAESRTAKEALAVHRHRWLEARRIERENAEERETDDWLTGRYARDR